ncbi:regulator of sigma E protease [Trypanosoma cruzi]|nr:regulator of sigma E protease [Trypanosoma cruzi]
MPLQILHGNRDADRLPATVVILCGDGVRLHRALSLARHLTHHRSRQRAVPPHHHVKSTALLCGGCISNTPTGAAHQQQHHQWERRCGVAWLAHDLSKMHFLVSCE